LAPEVETRPTISPFASGPPRSKERVREEEEKKKI